MAVLMMRVVYMPMLMRQRFVTVFVIVSLRQMQGKRPLRRTARPNQTELGTFAASRSWLGLLAILPLGIVLGAVHALTPGHGKSVLAIYIVGSRMRTSALGEG
jgi:ABC-type nickel/cobalt efflux system permease component RcnA